MAAQHDLFLNAWRNVCLLVAWQAAVTQRRGIEGVAIVIARNRLGFLFCTLPRLLWPDCVIRNQNLSQQVFSSEAKAAVLILQKTQKT